jgi:hypothetical protein
MNRRLLRSRLKASQMSTGNAPRVLFSDQTSPGGVTVSTVAAQSRRNGVAGWPVADLVVRNARVYTLDWAVPWAGAVAVSEGRISWVGADGDVGDHVGAGHRRDRRPRAGWYCPVSSTATTTCGSVPTPTVCSSLGPARWRKYGRESRPGWLTSPLRNGWKARPGLTGAAAGPGGSGGGDPGGGRRSCSTTAAMAPG